MVLQHPVIGVRLNGSITTLLPWTALTWRCVIPFRSEERNNRNPTTPKGSPYPSRDPIPEALAASLPIDYERETYSSLVCVPPLSLLERLRPIDPFGNSLKA